MTPKARARTFVGRLKDADDILKLVTGKRLRDIALRAWDIWGEDLVKIWRGEKTATGQGDKLVPSPYEILGLRPDCQDLVVKLAFRGLARQYHPDSGEHPDPKMFQFVTEAYNQILKERQEKKESE